MSGHIMTTAEVAKILTSEIIVESGLKKSPDSQLMGNISPQKVY